MMEFDNSWQVHLINSIQNTLYMLLEIEHSLEQGYRNILPFYIFNVFSLHKTQHFMELLEYIMFNSYSKS